MPRPRAAAATLVPTCPQPTIPNVMPPRAAPSLYLISSSTDRTYCATDEALHPGQLIHSIPARRMYPASMWSKPIVAVATKLTLLPPSRASSQRVRVRTIRASASRTSAGPISLPFLYTASAPSAATDSRM